MVQKNIFSLIDIACINKNVENNKENEVMIDDNKVIYRYDIDNETSNQLHADMSVPKGYFSAIPINNSEIITFGGNNGGGCRTDVVESYNFKGTTSFWKKLCPMPMSLFGFAAVNLNNEYIYIFGGYSYGCNHFQGAFKYNVTNKTWGTVTSMKTKRRDLAGVVIDSKIYAIGDGLVSAAGFGALDTVEMYDTTTSTANSEWVTLPTKLKTKRSRCCAVTINKIIYVFGGIDEKSNVLNTIEMYDASSDTSEWIQLTTTMNQSRCDATAIALGHYIFVIGGFKTTFVHSSDDVLDTIEIFDTKTNQFAGSTRRRSIGDDVNCSNEGPVMANRRGSACAAVLLGSSIPTSGRNIEGFTVNNSKLVVCGGYDGNSFLKSSETINIQTITIPLSKLNLPSDVVKEITSFL